jgi:hypothetical protein
VYTAKYIGVIINQITGRREADKIKIILDSPGMTIVLINRTFQSSVAILKYSIFGSVEFLHLIKNYHDYVDRREYQPLPV